MSNNDKKGTKSPDIIEDIVPGKNKDSNNYSSSNDKYDVKESALSVIKDLKESDISSDKRNTDKSGNQVSQYNQVNTNPQNQTIQSIKDMTEYYPDYQKQFINSFQSFFTPYFENVNDQLKNNQEFFRKSQGMYSTMISLYIQNIITFNKIFNDINTV